MSLAQLLPFLSLEPGTETSVTATGGGIGLHCRSPAFSAKCGDCLGQRRKSQNQSEDGRHATDNASNQSGLTWKLLDL